MPLNDNAPPATGAANGALHAMVTVASEGQVSDEEVPIHCSGCFLSETRLMRQRPKHGWAGYLPIASVFVGAGAGGWLAAAVGAIEWPIALVGAVIGYLVSGAILRWVYSDE